MITLQKKRNIILGTCKLTDYVLKCVMRMICFFIVQMYYTIVASDPFLRDSHVAVINLVNLTLHPSYAEI